MKKKISLWNKIKLFQSYKKSIKICKTELEQTFGARVDNAYRIYNVLNVPDEMIGEPYNLRKTDIDKFAETMIREYSVKLSEYFT